MKIVLGVVMGVVFVVSLRAQGAMDLPAHMSSVAAGADLTKKRSVAVKETSRRAIAPVSLDMLELMRRKVEEALPKTPFKLVHDARTADVMLEIVDEPRERWGTQPGQANPYVFLLLRERATGHLLYCAYQRATFVNKATASLMEEFVQRTRGKGPLPDGEIGTCAGEAMRPI